jgi:hypothetical protein
MPIPGLDEGGITPELKLRLKFYCFWTWWGFWCFFLYFSCPFCLFVCYIIVDFLLYCYLYFFFMYSLLYHHYLLTSTLSSLSSHLYSHPLHSPSFCCATIHCSPSQLLFLPLLIHSVPLSSPPPPILPQQVTTLLLPPTHSPPADQPTVPTLYNPNPLQSLIEAPYTTTAKIHPNTHKATKPSSPHIASSTHPPHFLPPVLLTP